MRKEITTKGKTTLVQLKELAKSRGLDIERHEDRAQLYEGLRPDVQAEIDAVAKERGLVVSEVVAVYVKLLIDHYKKVS